MIVFNQNKDKIRLIQQHNRNEYILVAGYIDKGENAEETVKREEVEELGIEVSELHYNKSEYFKNSNTLMLNFVRSEEHTSELQSRGHLVCRLLLEKQYNKLYVHRGVGAPVRPGLTRGGHGAPASGAGRTRKRAAFPSRRSHSSCHLRGGWSIGDHV